MVLEKNQQSHRLIFLWIYEECLPVPRNPAAFPIWDQIQIFFLSKPRSPPQLMNSPHSFLRKEQQSDGNSLNFPPPTLLTYLHRQSHSLPSSYYNEKKKVPQCLKMPTPPLTFWISSHPPPSHVKEIQACNHPVILHKSLDSFCLLDNSSKHTDY